MRLELTVQSIEAETVVLINAGQALVWPKNKLPDNLQPGQIIYFDINNQIEIKDELSAVELINNILKI